MHRYIISVATQKKTIAQSTQTDKKEKYKHYIIGEDRCYHKKGQTYS